MLDLPELDKSEDTDDVDVGAFELSMGEELELDEDEHKVDAFQVDIVELDDPGENEAASDLDIGSQLLDALPESALDGELEPPPTPQEGDLDAHLDEPLESDEPSSDVELGDDGLEDLPQLLNEEGDGDAGPEIERAFLPSAPEGDLAEGPVYEADWLLLGTAATALAAARGGVLAAAEHLMRFGDERQSLALPAGARATSIAELTSGNVLLTTPRGLIELTPGGAASLLEPPELARAAGAELVELWATRGEPGLWARLSSGALLRQRGSAWERHETFGHVRSLTGRDSDVTLLVLGDRPALQLSRDAGSSFHERPLPEPARTVALGQAPACVARGSVIAVFDAERGLAVSSDSGASFRMVTGAVNVTAVAIGDDAEAGRVFAALYREGRDASVLIAVDAERAQAERLEAERIAELSGAADEDTEETGRTQALLFIDGQLWAAGGYGLAKLTKAR